eukprot:165648-Pelagomonas_calceolata.AAC.7
MHLCKLVLKRLRRKGTSGGRSPWDPSFSWPGALQFVCPVVDVRHGAALRWAQLYNKNTPQGCVPCGPMCPRRPPNTISCARVRGHYTQVNQFMGGNTALDPGLGSIGLAGLGLGGGLGSYGAGLGGGGVGGLPGLEGQPLAFDPAALAALAGGHRECVGEWVRVLGTQPCAFNVFLEANCLSVGRSRVLEFAALSLLYTCVRSLLSSLGASSGLAGLSLPFSSAASQVRAAAAAAACAQSPCF